MGCGGSKPVEIIKPETAEEAYAAAADPKLAGQAVATSNLYGLEEGSRAELLEELFELVDDDASGTVDMDEYAQVWLAPARASELCIVYLRSFLHSSLTSESVQILLGQKK